MLLMAAMETAAQAGILNMAAAGNAGDNDTSPFDPASLPEPSIVSVAASDGDDNRAPWSNYGPESVDLAAPGVSILSTYGDSHAYLREVSPLGVRPSASRGPLPVTSPQSASEPPQGPSGSRSSGRVLRGSGVSEAPRMPAS